MPKRDNRRDNVERLEQMVTNTIEHIEEAHKTLQSENLSQEDRQAIEAKNARREESIQQFQSEIEDEKHARERGEI
ncbi:MAG: small acid-soluble spore protein Tlp [Bacillaceae bacterium]|nr:small acid-soluble spore protein Tlp [Bacillaceae bacterium]